mmetsp:Transcript_3618/g.14124  ORF Transcript_3618/g.14124 Transcript_3618/m.14124 type:complete len:295 (+) Transcript_3618:1732-2616(+)
MAPCSRGSSDVRFAKMARYRAASASSPTNWNACPPNRATLTVLSEAEEDDGRRRRRRIASMTVPREAAVTLAWRCLATPRAVAARARSVLLSQYRKTISRSSTRPKPGGDDDDDATSMTSYSTHRCVLVDGPEGRRRRRAHAASPSHSDDSTASRTTNGHAGSASASGAKSSSSPSRSAQRTSGSVRGPPPLSMTSPHRPARAAASPASWCRRRVLEDADAEDPHRVCTSAGLLLLPGGSPSVASSSASPSLRSSPPSALRAGASPRSAPPPEGGGGGIAGASGGPTLPDRSCA